MSIKQLATYTLCAIAWTAVIILFGCNPTRRITRIAGNHPDAAATVCSRFFPVKESTHVEIHTQIDTQVVAGPVRYINCDSIVKYVHDSTTQYVPVECPPGQLITKLVTKDSIVFVESTANIEALKVKVQALQSDVAGKAAKLSLLGWALGLLALYTVVRIALRVWLKSTLP